jgi:hypothetical protein
MATAPIDENPANLSDREGIILTKDTIENLGATRLGYLKKWFGIRTVQDLAALSVDKIEARFKSEGKRVPRRDEIESWIAQARAFVPVANLSSQKTLEPPEPKTEDKANRPTSKGEWEYIAAFAVEFRVGGEKEKLEIDIRPVDITESGDWGDVTGEKPTVVEGERLYPWMLQQVRDKMPWEPEEAPIAALIEDEACIEEISLKEQKIRITQMPPEEAKAAWEAIAAESEDTGEAAIVIEEPTAAPSVAVEITQVQAFQPPDVETPTVVSEAGQPFLGFLKSGEPFAFKVSFELTEPGVAEDAQGHITCRAHFYARNLLTGERLRLGDTKPYALIEGKMSYTAELPEAEATLEPGMYRLQVLTTLQGVRTAPGYLNVPLLQVM